MSGIAPLDEEEHKKIDMLPSVYQRAYGFDCNINWYPDNSNWDKQMSVVMGWHEYDKPNLHHNTHWKEEKGMKSKVMKFDPK